MRGEPIQAVKVGLNSLFASLKRDPYAMETVNLSIITFDRDANVLIPLSEIGNLTLPEIPDIQASPTCMGAALELLCQRYDMEVHKGTAEEKGDWVPLAVLMTDGSPSDTQLFSDMCEIIKNYKFARIIGCAAGPKAKQEPLFRFCTDVVSLETMDTNAFGKFWQWVSQIFTQHSKSSSIRVEDLPPPPPEIKIAI
jgi:uncharacterized protein YegL